MTAERDDAGERRPIFLKARNTTARAGSDREHVSGQPIHVHRVHPDADGCGHPDQHGRKGRVAGQRLCRAPVADDQIQGGLPALTTSLAFRIKAFT